MVFIKHTLLFILIIAQISFAQWFRQNPLSNLTSIFLIDVNTAVAVGNTGTILRTTNGGESWVEQTSGTTSDLFAVFFTDANNGTAVGYGGTILRTTNGGATFIEEEQIDEMPTEFMLSQNYPNPFNPSTSMQYAVSNL